MKRHRTQERPVLPDVFQSLQTFDITTLSTCEAKELRPILPCLVRMSLIAPLDPSRECMEGRKNLLAILTGIEMVNSIVGLLSIDFHVLDLDVRKELQLRQKHGSNEYDSLLKPFPLGEYDTQRTREPGLAIEFERSDASYRLRIVLWELLLIMAQVSEHKQDSEYYLRHSDLFDNIVYVEEVCDALCIALAELPGAFVLADIAETLLHVKHGPWILCCIVANMPDSFLEVCTTLISNGDKQEEDTVGGRVRLETLKMLCEMNPSQALTVRSKCVEHCRMPALAVTLSLQTDFPSNTSNNNDLVAFISGLLLGNDQNVRTWFSLYVRNGQKRKWEAQASLQMLREELMTCLRDILRCSDGSQLPSKKVVEASTLLRVYCAMKSFGALKFLDDEVSLIVRLLTSHPLPSPAGVRFVSLGLCMLVACPSLISSNEHEQQSIEWIRWLAQEEAYFESASGVSSSFGEMLLLMAIHFHSNQLSAICDLVCTTLGMKVPVRPNNLTRMKQIFTQEIFTEQVVTAHAVRVPVTANLNSGILGFLPIHCIYQLLKSRAFTKHRVPIKNWIYQQLCSCSSPLHPVLPPLIEVYVMSILIPSSKGSVLEHTNEPIAEQEIAAVFANSVSSASSPTARNAHSSQDLRSDNITSQLLLLYYVLLYEDQRLANVKTFLVAGRKVTAYSQELLSSLPIKHLLRHALTLDQNSFGFLFSCLLRLLATHYPHLCSVVDWLEREEHFETRSMSHGLPGGLSNSSIAEAFQNVKECPALVTRCLNDLLALPAVDMWPYTPYVLSHIKSILDPSLPRKIQELYKKVWLKLSTVLPRHLWVLTVNALIPSTGQPIEMVPLTEEDIVVDPLHILRCDIRVFRCAPVLEIVLRTLAAALAASRNHLSKHLLEHPSIVPKAGAVIQMPTDLDREELQAALIGTQESAAVQIVLEGCLQKRDETRPGELWALQEVRSLICSHLHQAFIGDPGLPKLVHFQGYPTELLEVTIRGVPSIHICLDFIPELMSKPELERQAFAVNLVSHLSLQYALPKSYSIARLAVNTLSTLLGVLTSPTRTQLFLATLPALARTCRAFPPLLEDVISLLLQLRRIAVSEIAVESSGSSVQSHNVQQLPIKLASSALINASLLKTRVDETFCEIVSGVVSQTPIYQ